MELSEYYFTNKPKTREREERFRYTQVFGPDYQFVEDLKLIDCSSKLEIHLGLLRLADHYNCTLGAIEERIGALYEKYVCMGVIQTTERAGAALSQ